MNPAVNTRDRRYSTASSDFLPPPLIFMPARDESPPTPPISPTPPEPSAGNKTISALYFGVTVKARTAPAAVKTLIQIAMNAFCRPRKRSSASKLRSPEACSAGSITGSIRQARELPRQYARRRDLCQKAHLVATGRCRSLGDDASAVAISPRGGHPRFRPCCWPPSRAPPPI